jgi:hypothetical protein
MKAPPNYLEIILANIKAGGKDLPHWEKELEKYNEAINNIEDVILW